MAKDFRRYIYALQVDSNKKVADITFNLKAQNITGTVGVTDLQLQAGTQVTAHVPNTSEMLEKVTHGINERAFIDTVPNPIKHGVQPRIYEGLTNRFYNIVGRGHDTIALPNVYHEDYMNHLVTSALNITLIPKDSYDLLRISTNDGALDEGCKYDPMEYPPLAEHPLNYRYTREFYFAGGEPEEEIKLHASIFSATLNNVNVPLAQGTLDINGHKMKHARQRFMMAPYGNFRIRIEFYKQVTEELTWTDEYGRHSKVATYLKDTGIGFYGYAEFEQFKGRAKY